MITKNVILTEAQYETIKAISKEGVGYMEASGITSDLRMAINFAARITGSKPCACNPKAVFSNIKKALDIYVPPFSEITESERQISSTETAPSEDAIKPEDNSVGE